MKDDNMKVERNHLFTEVSDKFNLEIIDSAYAIGDRNWKSKNIISPFSRLYFIESGEAIIKSGSEKIVMKPGNVYLVPTGHRFSWNCEKAYTKLFFHFNINKPDGYDVLANLRQFFSLKIDKNEVAKLIECYKSNNCYDVLYIKKAIYSVITSMIPKEKLDIYFQNNYSTITKKAIQYIASRLTLQQLNVKKIAEQLYISEDTLSKHFKDDLGITLKKYIDDQIFFTAEKMILKTEWSLAKISETLGFCDQFYFSRRFKQRYGCTPSEYKKNQNPVI